MVTVLRQQLLRITIGDRLYFATGDGLITNFNVRLSEQDRGNQCTLELYDPRLRLGNLLYSQFQAQGGILTPQGLLNEIKKQPVPTTETPKGGTASIDGYPEGDDLARLIISESIREGVTQREQIAYILATVEHESKMGEFREEIADGSAYEDREDLGNEQTGDGVRYKGRGYVQITGRRNYTLFGQKLGIDLVGKPELAAEPEYAIPILIIGMREGSFTGRTLQSYINERNVNFKDARRIINGMDRASLIAGYARQWLGKLDSLGYSTQSTEPESGTAILERLTSSQSPQASQDSPQEITFKQGTIIRIEVGFNDVTATSFEFYLTGIRLTTPNTTRITGKQLRFILAQTAKISAITPNTSIAQLAKKIQQDTGITVNTPPLPPVSDLVQQNESDYQALVKLAKTSGLFVRGDTREIKLEPLSVGDRTFTLNRASLLPGSYWGDEASTSRVVKGTVQTTSNLGTGQSPEILEESPPLDSPIEGEIGKGFTGQLLVDQLIFPEVLQTEPGHLVKLSADIGYGAAITRNFRIGEVTHSRNQSTLDIYLPVRIDQTKTKAVTGGQPGSNSLGDLVGDRGGSLVGEFKTPLKRGEEIAGYKVTSPYGMRTHPITGLQRLHGGVDVGCPTGTPYYVICKPGESVEVRRARSTTGGNMAIFEYDGFKFYYLHCSQVVASGTYSYGQVIAKCGNTGSSTAPHLHFTQKELNPTETVEPMRGYVFACLTGKFPN